MFTPIGSLCETGNNVLNVEWKIESFLSLSRPDAEYISPIFQFSDSSWCMIVYPYGDGYEENSDSVALSFHEMKYSSKEIFAFECGIKKANGDLYSQRSWTNIVEKSEVFGWRNICTRWELLQKKTDLLPSDALTISCTLRKFPSPRGLNMLSSDFESMLESAKYSDVTIRVETKEYKAHRNILAARSSVFSAMFEHEMAEKNSGEVSIVDCDPESFKEFLRFLYTDRADITEHNVCHLYKTADKYCLNELKRNCVAFMLQNLAVDNVCDVAAFGAQFSDTDLNFSCGDFFEQNVRDILPSSKWGTFMKNNNHVAHRLLKRLAPKIKLGRKWRRLRK